MIMICSRAIEEADSAIDAEVETGEETGAAAEVATEEAVVEVEEAEGDNAMFFLENIFDQKIFSTIQQFNNSTINLCYSQKERSTERCRKAV